MWVRGEYLEASPIGSTTESLLRSSVGTNNPRIGGGMGKPGKYLTVLVADGHAEIREAVCEYLNRTPGVHVVAEALSGFEVIAKVARLKPDIVLLDVGLPELNGIETARIVKRQFASTKVYLATLFEEDLYEMEAHRVAAEGIVSKSQLKRSLEALLRVAQHQASQ